MALIMLLLFIGVPLGELALLLWIADHTHWSFPLGLVIVSGMLGVAMLRIYGVLTLRKIRQNLQEGKAPADPLIDAGLMLLASGLLLTPGVVTDAVGLSAMFPPTRALWRGAVKRSFKRRFQIVGWSPQRMPGDDDRGGPPDVVEGEVVGRDK